MTDVAAGRTVGDGRYELRRRLGAGGMAAVWLARDRRLERDVAVKVLADTLAADEHYRERFDREARVAASVSDPHIVAVFDYGIEDERPFLVMEYIVGGTLAQRLNSAAGAPLSAARLARQLLGALSHIHDAGLVHRDVKPANILLDRLDNARLTDFGIARALDATSLTQTGMVIGTLRYIAPEVMEGASATPASDLFSAGRVLGEAAARDPAAHLDPLIAGLTAADPSKRPRSAAAAIGLLEPRQTRRRRARPAHADRPDSSDPPGRPGPPPTRHRTPTAATAATRAISGRALTAATRVSARLSDRGVRRETQWAILAVGTVIVVLALIAVLGGGSSARPTAGPAPSGASLHDQLNTLTKLVDQAAKP